MKHLSIASTVVVLIVFLVTLVVTAIDSIGSDYSDIRISLAIAGVAAIVASIVMVIWAIPVHLLLRKYSRSNIAWYVLAATIPSFIFVYLFKPFGHDKNLDLLGQALFCSLAGGLGAITFWYIVVYRQRITNVSN